jgi:hypothetical protein
MPCNISPQGLYTSDESAILGHVTRLPSMASERRGAPSKTANPDADPDSRALAFIGGFKLRVRDTKTERFRTKNGTFRIPPVDSQTLTKTKRDYALDKGIKRQV